MTAQELAEKALTDQVFDPATDRRPRIADLNKRHNPDDLSHYVRTDRMDEKIMGADAEVIALCGFRWARHEEAEVDVYANARAPRMEVCPVCHVLYSRMLDGTY